MKTHIICNPKSPTFWNGKTEINLCLNTTPFWSLHIKENITQEQINNCNCKRCLNRIKKHCFLTKEWQIQEVSN
jgi:hypothetical protein